MSETMVEKVARAIQEGLLAAGIHSDQYVPQDIARAAIEAMREPTKRMIGEAMIQPHPSVDESGGIIAQGQRAIVIDYQAMIDAALHDPEGGEA